MKIKGIFLLILGVLLIPGRASAEIVVVVAAEVPVRSLSREEVVDIFLGRYRQLPTGQSARPVDVANGEALRADFYRLLVDKSPAQIGSYWARLTFSGKARPPAVLPSQRDVMEAVVRQPGTVGYIDRKWVDSRVRVVYTLAK